MSQVAKELAHGFLQHEMKRNIKREFDAEVAQVRGLINETQNLFLKPMLSNLNQIICESLDCEKYFSFVLTKSGRSSFFTTRKLTTCSQ